MNWHQFVPKGWIISPKARGIYRLAAAVSLTLYLFIAAAVLKGPIQPLKPALLVAVVATALNLVGMEIFLFRFDDSPALKQIFWFCLMIFLPLGPALYCFMVYSRSKVLRTEVGQQGAGGASVG